jgi:maleate isomerase
MRGTRIAPALERELGLPVYDSIAATLWGSLGLVSREHADMTEPSLAGWGSMFAIPPAAGRRAT